MDAKVILLIMFATVISTRSQCPVSVPTIVSSSSSDDICRVLSQETLTYTCNNDGSTIAWSSSVFDSSYAVVVGVMVSIPSSTVSGVTFTENSNNDATCLKSTLTFSGNLTSLSALNGVTLSCTSTGGSSSVAIMIPSPPNAPTNLYFNILSTSNTDSSVNLTWSLGNQCVVVYHVEVTNTNTSNITNMNTTSQYIVLTLQTGVVYSFRVRGADSAGRGEWSEPSMFTPGFLPTSTTLNLPTVPTLVTSTTTIPWPTANVASTGSLCVVPTVVLVVIIVLLLAILTMCSVAVCFLAFKVRSYQTNAIQQHSQQQDYKQEPSNKESMYDEIDLTKNQVEVSRNPAYAVIASNK